MKKAQGLSLNTIIIAVIVLIVLIVLWVMFTGRMAKFTSDINECRTGCVPAKQCRPPSVIDTQGNGACGQKQTDIKTDRVGLSVNIPGVLEGEERQLCCIKLDLKKGD